MKKILMTLSVLLLVTLGFFGFLGQQSKSGSAPGLLAGKLHPCPTTPNCVNSELHLDAAQYIEPLAITSETSAAVLANIEIAIADSGGVITTRQKNYLAATYRSSLFGFIDDLEIRIDTEQHQLHFRSASRVGKSDFGANRKRVEKLKAGYIKLP